MKVKELIEQLQKLDKDLYVMTLCDRCDNMVEATVCIADNPDDYPDDWNMPDKWVEIA